ncbi:hypothetical protein CR159_09280 [Pollutimonas subterranea]|uniref:Transposase IS4-like domain-containing protein n=1 Tax=Pollutimonas subterranea TaxID=2045210 RepID=A0A2N4U5A4_9BURK|nr:transposase [Pollutimonas subterranea]PLC50187.1 hypothetical protein CR159_09280 [Pollutimonas subterranea]
MGGSPARRACFRVCLGQTAADDTPRLPFGSTRRTPTRRTASTHPIQLRNRKLAEHPFRVIKRQFGHVKVRYRGLAKNTTELMTLFAAANLWRARKPLMRTMAELRP